MYLIQDANNRFIKRTTNNQITYTYSESLADVFPSECEANDFIRKMFSKKARKKYRAVKSENDSELELVPLKPDVAKESTVNLKSSIDSFNETIHTHLDPEIESYSKKLQEYDGMILDIRHWLRHENTNNVIIEQKLTELIMEKELLNKELAKCSSDHKATSQSKINEIARLTDILENQPLQFNDELVRQMLQCIVVENKERIKVIFNDGTEIDEPVI